MVWNISKNMSWGYLGSRRPFHGIWEFKSVLYNVTLYLPFSLLFSHDNHEAYMYCEYIVDLMASKMCILVFKNIVLISDRVMSIDIIHINRSSLESSIILREKKGLESKKKFRITFLGRTWILLRSAKGV